MHGEEVSDGRRWRHCEHLWCACARRASLTLAARRVAIGSLTANVGAVDASGVGGGPRYDFQPASLGGVCGDDLVAVGAAGATICCVRCRQAVSEPADHDAVTMVHMHAEEQRVCEAADTDFAHHCIWTGRCQRCWGRSFRQCRRRRVTRSVGATCACHGVLA